MSTSTTIAPPSKKPRTHFDVSWKQQFKGIGRSIKGMSFCCIINDTYITLIYLGDTFAHCSLCGSDFSVSHAGKHDVLMESVTKKQQVQQLRHSL